MRNRIPQALIFVLLSTLSMMGQINCTNSNKLVCQVPFSTGVFNTTGLTPAEKNKLLQQAQLIASGFNSAIATQTSQLPLASSSSGTVVLYKAGVPQTYDNLGPILSERAPTVGKHQLFLSFTASQFFFTDIDGLSLHKVPFSYAASSSNSTLYVTETVDSNFKVNQYVGIGTFGVTDKLDVSIIVPIERVSIGSSNLNGQEYILDAQSNLGQGPFPVTQQYFHGTASGLGDIVFGAKYVVRAGERSTLSVGLYERVPTGDDLNYLGSGAWGTNPYAAYSYVSRVSPHARLGYQWNSETELNPNLTRSGNLALPGGLQYDIGADWSATKHLTIAGDLMGNQYQNAPRLVPSTSVLKYQTGQPPVPVSVPLHGIIVTNSTYWINDISAGAKWNPWKELIVTGNVLFQLNNVGMRARPTPLVGVSYKFGIH